MEVSSMAVRRELGRARRISDRDVEQLRENVRDGIPFHQPQSTYQERGYADLIFLSTGAFYAVTDFITTRDDREMALELWGALREEMILNHVKHKPQTRPWSFYALEDRESRRRLGRAPCTCRPGVSRPGVPPLNLSCFGRPSECRCEYESEAEYLKRLHLLTPDERKKTPCWNVT
jgi:hypothetical protein